MGHLRYARLAPLTFRMTQADCVLRPIFLLPGAGKCCHPLCGRLSSGVSSGCKYHWPSHYTTCRLRVHPLMPCESCSTGRKGPYAAYYVQIKPDGGSFVGKSIPLSCTTRASRLFSPTSLHGQATAGVRHEDDIPFRKPLEDALKQTGTTSTSMRAEQCGEPSPCN